MRLIIAGGGTGGHLFPGIAVAEEFLARDSANEVLFVGTERGIEARLLPRLGYRLELINATGLKGKGGISQLKGIIFLLYAYAQSRKILKAFRPDMVLGVGGYASAPLVLAARGMQIPRFIHEQNALPGVTNRYLAKIADQAFISLTEAERFLPKEKTVLTGNPLRRSIVEGIAGELREPVAGKFNLLVFGGSAGAHSINMAMIQALPQLAGIHGGLRITHQTGENDFHQVRDGYRAAGIEAEVVPFIDDMAAAYKQADLIICRAGATTIAEVTAGGKACIFIPYPFAADDHQLRNAESLVDRGAGFLIKDKELSGDTLAAMVRELIADPVQLAEVGRNAREMARLDAAKEIVDRMLEKNG